MIRERFLDGNERGAKAKATIEGALLSWQIGKDMSSLEPKNRGEERRGEDNQDSRKEEGKG
jgi:hypothetical protein